MLDALESLMATTRVKGAQGSQPRPYEFSMAKQEVFSMLILD